MRVHCAWCGKIMPSKGEESDDISHTICLECVHKTLHKLREEQEHEAWMLAFEAERLSSRTSRTTDGIRGEVRRKRPHSQSRTIEQSVGHIGAEIE